MLSIQLLVTPYALAEFAPPITRHLAEVITAKNKGQLSLPFVRSENRAGNQASGGRTDITGQVALRTTRSAVLPNRK
ncbi:hypothetical protein GURASL_12620 [Geotalea uraniireducens]|uniref:Uncharacterized protein n=1 Tax=Geotalea uraniireducens TaxID=351604 RepID=A0ABM8EIL1_9BACT|nr:hypothetical protein GURASL_12620 [Geotalea uraniireducens]